MFNLFVGLFGVTISSLEDLDAPGMLAFCTPVLSNFAKAAAELVITDPIGQQVPW